MLKAWSIPTLLALALSIGSVGFNGEVEGR